MIALYTLVLICVGMLTCLVCLVWVVLTTKDSEDDVTDDVKKKGVWFPWLGIIFVCIGFIVLFVKYGVLPALAGLTLIF